MGIEVDKDASNAVRELNELTLATIRELARMEDGNSVLRTQFGLSARTVDAVRQMRAADILKLSESLRGTYLFASKNTDEILYRLIRSGAAEDDVVVLSRLRLAAAAKRMEA